MKFSPRRQRGNAVVETALIMPLLMGSALVIGDLYHINQARALLEQAAHGLASNLAMQSRLDTDALEALVAQVASPDILGDYELLISKVNLDRSMDWEVLRRGSEEGLCPQYSEQKAYSGELPEEQEAEEDDEDAVLPSSHSVLVVQLCRSSDNLVLHSALLSDKNMQAIAFNRIFHDEIELDKALSKEVGIDYQE